MNASDGADAPRVKICGVTRREDAVAAVNAGADYVGMILSRGFERTIDAESAREIVHSLGTDAVAVLVDEPVDATVDIARGVGVTVVQLHGSEPPGLLAELRERGEGSWSVWKALRVREPSDLLHGLQRYGDVADGLLLDGWHPSRVGGTGSTFAWDDARGARDAIPEGMTVIAAGGLTPDNVARAVEALRPDVVDVSSGVERTTGIKDPELIEAFVTNARRGR